MLGAGEQGSDRAGAEQRLAADARGAEAGAVKAVPEGDRLVPSGDRARELEGHLDRLGAARREHQLVEIAGRDRRQLPGQRHGRLIGKAPRRERQLVQLRLQRGNQSRMAVAQMMHVIAVEIQIAAAGEVLEPESLARAGSPIGTATTRPDGGSGARRPRPAPGPPGRGSDGRLGAAASGWSHLRRAALALVLCWSWLRDSLLLGLRQKLPPATGGRERGWLAAGPASRGKPHGIGGAVHRWLNTIRRHETTGRCMPSGWQPGVAGGPAAGRGNEMAFRVLTMRVPQDRSETWRWSHW